MDALSAIRAKRGELSRIAAALGITRGAVSAWERIPAERVPAVSEVTGIPPHRLRPDLWHPPHSAADAPIVHRSVSLTELHSDVSGCEIPLKGEAA